MQLGSKEIHVFILSIKQNSQAQVLKLASQYTHKKLKVGLTKFKKPYFKNDKYLHFNKSHSGHKLVFAFSRSAVGIDIEKIKNRSRQDKIAKKISSISEFKKYQRSKNKKLEFYKLWTKKEALSKLNGKGLRIGFRKISKLKGHTKTKKIGDSILSVASVRIKSVKFVSI
jgi:phosphopantetheinyl transferase